jgi:nucleoid DNA-binding protein
MSKVQLHELAEALGKKRGLTQEESARFAAAMFDVIRDSLAVEGLVKVKGLGTFKVVGVEARESVSVNTGERIVIGGHEKVTFTPDVEMKEMVNRPFSQFETVELNEGVTFERMETTAEPEVKTAVAAVAEMPAELIVETPVATVSEMPAEPKAETLISPVAEMPAEPVMETPIASVAELSVEPETETLIAPIAEMPAEPETTATETESVTESEERINTENMTLDDYGFDRKPRSRSWMLWLALVLVAAGVAYYIGLRQSNVPKNLEYVEADAPKVRHESGVVTSADSNNTAVRKAVAPDAMASKAPGDSAVAATEPTVPEKPAATEGYDKYEQMDVRVRTGAYRIKGTDRVVKARRGDDLERIARRELGEGMVCYVSVYNQLTDDAELTEGQQIKIPKLEWKRKARK